MRPGPGGAPPDESWEEHASWWQREFTEGADPEYEEQILPLVRRHLAGSRRVLEVGTGEGQVARALAAGHGSPAVTGIDPSRAQVDAARLRGGGPTYARAVAGMLPFRCASFDAVVACLVLEHVHDVHACIAEIARVLAPAGRFLFLLNHPLLQTPGSGWIDDRILDEQYWRIGPYLVESSEEEEVARGVRIPFVHRPLSVYVNVMASAGLLVTRMDEPSPPAGFLARAKEYEAAASIPRLLVLLAERSRRDPAGSRGHNGGP